MLFLYELVIKDWQYDLYREKSFNDQSVVNLFNNAFVVRPGMTSTLRVITQFFLEINEGSIIVNKLLIYSVY